MITKIRNYLLKFVKPKTVYKVIKCKHRSVYLKRKTKTLLFKTYRTKWKVISQEEYSKVFWKMSFSAAFRKHHSFGNYLNHRRGYLGLVNKLRFYLYYRKHHCYHPLVVKKALRILKYKVVPPNKAYRRYHIAIQYSLGYSLEEIADNYGVTRERIRQLINKVVRESQVTKHSKDKFE